MRRTRSAHIVARPAGLERAGADNYRVVRPPGRRRTVVAARTHWMHLRGSMLRRRWKGARRDRQLDEEFDAIQRPVHYLHD